MNKDIATILGIGLAVFLLLAIVFSASCGNMMGYWALGSGMMFGMVLWMLFPLILIVLLVVFLLQRDKEAETTKTKKRR